MLTSEDPTLDARNSAAFDLAIEMLGLALRTERGPEHGQAQLLRSRLAQPAAPEVLRERVRIGSYGSARS